MRQTYDLEEIVYGVLKGTTALTSTLTGGIYPGDRPDNSVAEDVCINTINLTQQYFPQIGTSNVNIHVPDKQVTIGGKPMKIEDRSRLKTLAGIVLTALRSAKITGLQLTVENQNVINEPEITQHFVNIRIGWKIHA